MALDMATQALLGQMAESGGKPLNEMTPEEARGLSAMLAELAGPAPTMSRVEDHQVPVEEGEVPVRVLVPPQPPRGILVYYHGGGWVIGTIDEFDTLGKKLAERTSCTVVLVDYRLAPEHRYPVAVDDSYAALEWIDARRADLAGASDAPLFVAGDSAGGNLSAVMALRARDRNGPRIAQQLLVYPVTDADFTRASYTEPENQTLLTKEAMEWFWDHYLPDTARRAEPDASPLRAGDLSGLPPALVITAEHDVLRDEGEAYAARLKEAGVDVDLRRIEGQMHGFFTLLMLPGSERAFQYIVKATKACIAHHEKNKTAVPSA